MSTPILPYPDMDFTPLDILTAEEMNQLVANQQYLKEFAAGLANGTNLENDVVKSLNKFSDSKEVVAGEWIDGKTIYRKVFSFRFSTSDTHLTTSIADLSIDKIIRLTGVYNADVNESGPLYYWQSNDGVRAFIASNRLQVQMESNYPSRPLYAYIILEYTKN